MNEPIQASHVLPGSPEIRRAYHDYVSDVRVRNSKVACGLVIALMPAGLLLDWFVYHDQAISFLKLRLLASAVALLVFLGLRLRNLSGWQSRLLCMGWYLIPAASISLMIYRSEGVISPYYAGLNLVILAVSSVIQATLEESIVAVFLILLMYCAACGFHPPAADALEARRQLVNNFYFISLTAIIVVTGNFFFNRLRFREFILRYELDRNRKALEESNQKLMELDQIKGRFFANISHELRTPLTLLLSPLETMLHGQKSKFDQDTLYLMSIMQSNGLRLLKLINDLLDLVRLESGRMEVKREPLELNAFIRGLMGAPDQMATAKGLKLTVFVPPGLGALMLDRDKLEKSILNLVFNALKFTPAGGTVALRLEPMGEQLVITVEDTGVGISQKNLPFVFDRFWQADNSSKRKYQGVGIGLSLVKELSEVQGGSVGVTSVEGKGTTFTISLPLVRPAEGQMPAPEPVPVARPAVVSVSAPPVPLTTTVTTIAPPASAAPPQSEEWLSNLYRRAALLPSTPALEVPTASEAARNGAPNGDHPSLLVADDEPDMLRFLKSQLVSHYRVTEAVDGVQAVEKAGPLAPDIILLDMNMPGKDGLQVCRELRQQPVTRETPIIILTARADEETKLAALSAGANDFLTKPFSTSELHVRVKNLVESNQLRQKLAGQNKVLESTIEQLKETETMLVQTEKMVSLGRMSAGIIHEINNPLNYATTGLYALRNKGKHLAADEQAEYTEILKDVEDGIKRVKGIVSDLKTFTHPDTEKVDSVEIAPIIGSALRFLSNEWKEKVVIEQQIAEPLAVSGNRNKLLQVFVNLLQNSLDALKHKSPEEKAAITITGLVENNRTVITVRDNGEGIEADALGKVFDPFFTTKEVGEGMGLGLTICYRIVQEYGGQITVRSERGKFCEFRLEFPAKA